MSPTFTKVKIPKALCMQDQKIVNIKPRIRRQKIVISPKKSDLYSQEDSLRRPESPSFLSHKASLAITKPSSTKKKKKIPIPKKELYVILGREINISPNDFDETSTESSSSVSPRESNQQKKIVLNQNKRAYPKEDEKRVVKRRKLNEKNSKIEIIKSSNEKNV